MSEQNFKNHQHDDQCECGHEEHYDEDVIYLTLEDDTELKCHVLGFFELDNKDYIALLPEGEYEVLIFNYVEDEEGIEINNIDDDEEFERVSDYFMNEFKDELEMMADDYDFDDDFDEDYDFDEEDEQ